MKQLLLLAVLSASTAHAQELSDIVAPQARLQTLAKGFNFTEGPAWNARGFWVFSDIPANTLFKIAPDGQTSIVRRPTGNSNGNTYDSLGRLVSCEHSGRRVSRKRRDGTFETLVDRFEGKRLNSPNDLAIRSDGSIYFTDPTYGVGMENSELGFRGLYRLHPNGKLELLDRDWEQPNGIAFSPDETKLYVGDSQGGRVWVYDVDEAGKLSGKKLFASIAKPGDPDGIKTDARGRVLVTGPGGIHVFNPRGGKIGIIRTPLDPANLAWGGRDGNVLMITARGSIYSLQMRVGASSTK